MVLVGYLSCFSMKETSLTMINACSDDCVVWRYRGRTPDSAETCTLYI